MTNKILLSLLCAVMLTLFIASLLAGPTNIHLTTALQSLVGRGNPSTVLVMQEIRLPRAILGLMIGATLGLSGAVLQGYLRNPLADPGILGISASASLGAVIAIYTGLTVALPLALPLLAIGAAIFAVLLVQALAGAHAKALTLILTGVAVTSFASALTALALNLSPNPFAALEIVFWMLGSLSDRSMLHVLLAAPFILIGWVLLAWVGRGLDALTLGRDVAFTLGFSPWRMQWLIILGTALSVGAATAIAGSIGFVGLVIPHLLRPLVGAQPSRLLVASAFGGASLVLAADLAVRVIAPEKDLKLGVLTAIVGAPFFLHLIVKTRRGLS